MDKISKMRLLVFIALNSKMKQTAGKISTFQNKHCFFPTSFWRSFKNYLNQCFSNFLLQRNLPQMFALLMEPYAMIWMSIFLQPHRHIVANFVQGKFGQFRRNPWKPLAGTRGSAESRLKNNGLSQF